MRSSTRKPKVLAIIIAGSLMVGALGVGVAAKFTEGATSGTTSITAATGRIELGGALNDGVVVTDIVPGDTVTRNLTVKNGPNGSGLGYAWSESLISFEYQGLGGTGIYQFNEGPTPMTIQITDLGDDGVVGGGDDLVIAPTQSVAALTQVSLSRATGDVWASAETRVYQVALTFPESAINTYEGAHAELAFTINATQRAGAEADTYNSGGPGADPNSQVDNYLP